MGPRAGAGFAYRLPVDRDGSPPSSVVTYVCIYNVTTGRRMPFLRYMLYKYDDGTMTFPTAADSAGADAVYTRCCGAPAPRPAGFIAHRGATYMFYEYTGAIPLAELPSKHRLWWALITEMCNERMVITFPVDEAVYSLFYANQALCHLWRDDGVAHPSPVALYYGDSIKSAAYTALFGVQQADPSALYGPYFYFSTFVRAVRYAGWDYVRATRKSSADAHKFPAATGPPPKRDDGAVVRLAVFLGDWRDMRVLLGHGAKSDDDLRESLVDREGMWAKTADSLYAGPVRDSAGKLSLWAAAGNAQPSYVVKNFRRQAPLSLHAIDDGALGEGWVNDGRYAIS